MARKIALVSCVSQKQTEPMEAQALYISDWFKKASEYARRKADAWYILSAEHGLVEPTQVIAPYDKTLHGAPRDQQRAWAERVMTQLQRVLKQDDYVVLLAGKDYRRDLYPALAMLGYQVSAPMGNMGIGKQKRWLMDQVAADAAGANATKSPTQQRRFRVPPILMVVGAVVIATAAWAYWQLTKPE